MSTSAVPDETVALAESRLVQHNLNKKRTENKFSKLVLQKISGQYDKNVVKLNHPVNFLTSRHWGFFPSKVLFCL